MTAAASALLPFSGYKYRSYANLVGIAATINERVSQLVMASNKDAKMAALEKQDQRPDGLMSDLSEQNRNWGRGGSYRGSNNSGRGRDFP